MHRLEIIRAVKPQVSQDQINLAVQRALQDTLGEKLAREFQKLETRVLTGSDMARMLRNRF
jgi:hypothetical protein